jgi:hypothetical protein
LECIEGNSSEYSLVCSGILEIWFDARRNQKYFVLRKAEWLEKEINIHIKVRNKT